MRGILAAKVEEIVREVVRGVRTPVREEEIRRRQREEFLSINAEQGLYFTPRVYDGFMLLLQRAKAIALAAERGDYDPDTNSGNDTPGTPHGEAVPEEGGDGARQGLDNAVLAGAKTIPTAKGSNDHGPEQKGGRDGNSGGGGNENGERSECSTRPASALSSSEGADDDGSSSNDGDDNEDDDEGGKVEAQDPSHGSNAGDVTVEPTEVEGQENSAMAGAEEGERGVEQEAGRDEDGTTEAFTEEDGGRGGDTGGGEDQASAQSLLRGMLERLDCGEWDGDVNTVLAAIDGLTRWIPVPPPALPPPPPPLPSAGMDESDGVLLTPGAEGLADLDADGTQRGGRDDDGMSAASGDGDDADDDDDEEEEEEEEEEGEEEEDEEGDEDDVGDDEEEGPQHPVFAEQRALRAQWRRLVLDAQLEPETDECLELMRETVGNMVAGIPAAMEQARRDSALMAAGKSAAGGKSAAVPATAADLKTPRGGVLGFDKDSIANWAAACPGDVSTRETDAREGGPQARAAAAAKAGNRKASFLALAYGEVSSRVAAAAESFEASLSEGEGARREVVVAARRAAVLEGPDGLLSGRDAAVRRGDGNGGSRGGASRGDSRGPRSPSPSPPPPPLSRLGALKWEDVGGRRILLHVDLSKGATPEDGTYGGSLGVGGGDGIGHDGTGGRTGQQEFPKQVRMVAEQVREVLSAKPAAVAIVSEMAPPALATAVAPATATLNIKNSEDVDTQENSSQSQPLAEPGTQQEQQLSAQHPPAGDPAAAQTVPSSPECGSLRASAAAVSSLLGMEVAFYDTVPDLAAALERCAAAGGRGGGGGLPGAGGGDDVGAGSGDLPPFGMVPLMMAERLSLPGVVPAPPVDEPELSDGEEERLPDFSWEGEEAEAAAEHAKEIEAARLKVQGPGEGDLGELLAGVVDVAVMDAPRALYEPRRKLPWGPVPTTGLTVAGSGKKTTDGGVHGDITAMAYLTEASDRPLLAIVGGGSLEPRLKLIDGLLDLVDTLAIGGGLAATFVAASSTEAATATGWKGEGAVDASGSSGNNTQSVGGEVNIFSGETKGDRGCKKRSLWASKIRVVWVPLWGVFSCERCKRPQYDFEKANRLILHNAFSPNLFESGVQNQELCFGVTHEQSKHHPLEQHCFSGDTCGSSMGTAGAQAAAAAAEARKRAKARKNRWTGKGTAGKPRDPLDVVEAARKLLVKARKRGVEVILPSDFVVGDIEVDENGPLPGQVLSGAAGPDKDDEENDKNDNGNDSTAGSVAPGGEGAGADGVMDAAALDVEPEDPAMGFEYEGEDAVGRARAVLWHGMLGVAECSAFQFGTRDVLEAARSAHDNDEMREAGTSPVVILCGRSLGEWAGRFAEGDEGDGDDVPPLGSGSGVSHVLRRGPFGEDDEDDDDEDGSTDAGSSRD
ncbi:unnamed protein product [Ectocarpus sp. CCAP 1310/34]|nr:unnamed protein product [Ectocarpus sp. CCAP 1310/34]